MIGFTGVMRSLYGHWKQITNDLYISMTMIPKRPLPFLPRGAEIDILDLLQELCRCIFMAS
jgi:hypothetical protein